MSRKWSVETLITLIPLWQPGYSCIRIFGDDGILFVNDERPMWFMHMYFKDFDKAIIGNSSVETILDSKIFRLISE